MGECILYGNGGGGGGGYATTVKEIEIIANQPYEISIGAGGGGGIYGDNGCGGSGGSGIVVIRNKRGVIIMAKNMARIENGVIVGVEWCSDRTVDTETLVSVYDRPVTVGDTYDGQDFYRNSEKILTPLEEAEKRMKNSNLRLLLLV